MSVNFRINYNVIWKSWGKKVLSDVEGDDH